ncbi:AAA family ATPase [Pseudonocardia bannensis]|uniref:P-loop NTPase n=1 Tax=Pseudonocardia bannensis TaxID=630973 RepID=A0A848DMR9_9PSEU|nr:P-loop NTPase [Pseudonocardia bannensis]NMH94090.1 P-loop NTPase [Pseudonocardia bannensis]
MTILVCSDPRSADVLGTAVGGAHVVAHLGALRRHLSDSDDELVVIGPDIDLAAASEFAAAARVDRPALGVVLVRHRVDTGVLGQALRAGFREVVPAHETQRLGQACVASRALSEQVRRAAGLTPATTERRRGRIVTVFGGKGGAGKSIVATNLGVALAQSGTTACLVDLDLAFGDVAVLLGLFPERTLADAVPMASSLDAAGAASLVTAHASGLHTVLAPAEPRTAEHVPADLVTRLLPLLAERYDVVVVDTPPAFTEHVLAALDATDELILVTTPEVPSIKNLKLTLQTLDLLGHPADRRRIVLNRADAQLEIDADDVAQMVGASVHTEVPADRTVPLSINRGVPVVLDQPKHPVAHAIRRIAATLDSRPEPPPDPVRHRSARRGLRRKAAVR